MDILLNDNTTKYLISVYRLEPIDRLKLNKAILCDMYNNSDIDALFYMYSFLTGELRTLCERLINLNTETKIGSGDEDYSYEELEEYSSGKWKLLEHFGIKSDLGNAICSMKWNELNDLQKELAINQYIYIRACEDEITEDKAKEIYDTSDGIMRCMSYLVEDGNVTVLI